MSVTINTSDKRDMRAQRLLRGARGWLKCEVNIPGVGLRKAYGIPSESEPGVYRLADRRRCNCQDFQNRQGNGFACAHIRAVRLWCEIVFAERRRQQQRAAQAIRNHEDDKRRASAMREIG